MRLAIRYAFLGATAGLLAPTGLFAYAVATDRALDPLVLFAALAIGGVVTFATAGVMIGRRDEALMLRNGELARLSARFQTLSALDPLTRLPNRRSFDERLAAELARSARYETGLALVMIDLDEFKRLNDRHGHLAGDEVLRQTATLLLAESRLGDVVARWGGEEFVALLPHTDAAAAAAWAERARVHIAGATVAWPAGPLTFTASFGIAAISTGEVTADELVAAADAALYEAKRRGRNQVVVAPPLPRRDRPRAHAPSAA